jgi:hypothetical protein
MASITDRFVPLVSELEGWALLSSWVPALKQSSLEGLGSHSGAPSEVDASLSSPSTNVKAELAGLHCRMSYCRSCGRCTTITRPVSGVRTVGEGAPSPRSATARWTFPRRGFAHSS